MEEERVVKSVRNDVNRQINAELANQQKAASAAVEQIYAIRRVVEHYGMEDLPPALQEFIRLRVTYPEASLKELGRAVDAAPFQERRLPPRPPPRVNGRRAGRGGVAPAAPSKW